MMHLLARLREMEAWSRLESAAATAAWADGTKPEDAASRVAAALHAPASGSSAVGAPTAAAAVSAAAPR